MWLEDLSHENISTVNPYIKMIAEVSASVGIEPDAYHHGKGMEKQLAAPSFTLYWVDSYDSERLPVQLWLEAEYIPDKMTRLTWVLDIYWETEEQKAKLDKVYGAVARVLHGIDKFYLCSVNIKVNEW